MAKNQQFSKRDQGDGSCDPDIHEADGKNPGTNQDSHQGPSECSHCVEAECIQQSSPFSLPVELDVLQLSLFIIGIVIRTYGITFPDAAVFDELHYGRFAIMYLQRTFFFDTQPPLGKMLLALPAYLSGYTGNFSADRIGAEFDADLPVMGMRLVPAVCGALLVPLVYQVLVELRLSRYTAGLGAVLIILDNALLTESRFMLIDAPMILFMAFSILSYLKFKQLTHRPFSAPWWSWLVLCGLSSGFNISVKYIGGMTLILILLLAAKDFWFLLPDWRYSDKNVFVQALCRVCCLVILPVFIYLTVFYIHLTVLHKAGPHDNIMSSSFQAGLKGGLASITKGQPLHITYGSQVTLRRTHGQPCWLHSHVHLYPVRYDDGRGSSHQQQVTCYTYKDVNNWWIVKNPHRDSVTVEEPIKPIVHGDVIQLVHGITTRALNSHDVAAPVSPQNQEVSCYINYNISMEAQNLWRLDIINRENDSSSWNTIQSHIRLVHMGTQHALKVSGKQLGDWGFHQLEVVADRFLEQPDTLWNVEEHRYTTSDEESNRASELSKADLIPTQPTQLSFWSKMAELQWAMLTTQHDNPSDHKYSSRPSDWPLMGVNVAYWADTTTGAQIQLIGNLVLWITASLGVPVAGALFIFHLLRRRRLCYDINHAYWQQFLMVCQLLLGGFLIHYAPFFLTDRTLFLHHYMPALVFKIILLPALIQHVYSLSSCSAVRCTLVLLVLVWLCCVIQTFIKFSLFTYGIVPLTSDNITDYKWLDSWDFIQLSSS